MACLLQQHAGELAAPVFPSDQLPRSRSSRNGSVAFPRAMSSLCGDAVASLRARVVEAGVSTSSSSFHHLQLQQTRAVAVAEQDSLEAASAADGKTLLEVRGLSAVVADSGKEILKGVDLVIKEGEVSHRGKEV